MNTLARYMKEIGKNVQVENLQPPNLITSYASSLCLRPTRISIL